MALKILLADDSMTAQNMGKKILMDAGYEVVAVSNGAAAIKKIGSERPDIAILDEYMPGYMGSEVCERVKAASETAKMPVLLTVGKMEPFDQEKANKVHADGVMIKPFEASDLIAAVQSIAQRLLAPAPPPRGGGHDATVQLRAGMGSLEDTLRVPPPRPKAEPNPEDTLRLTAQEIRAFQDASYHDWAKSAEPHLEDHEKAAAEAEMAVTPAVEEESHQAPMAAEEEAPAMHAAAMDEEAPTVRETPVFSAMSASGVAAEHEIFTASAMPMASMHEVTEEPSTAPAFYTPPTIDTVAEESPVFAVQSAAPVMEPEPVAPEVESEAPPVAPILEPVVESVHMPAVEAAPVLETSSPLTPGPMPVEQAADLEPTIAPSVEVVAAPAHELEITSPPPERGGSAIVQDAALITESDDMSEFVTKFGVEGAETVHVGVVSDLSDEQLAAIMTPVSEGATVTPAEAVPAEPPAVSEIVTPTVVEETPAVDVAPVEVAQIEAPQDVVSIEAVEPVEEVPSVVIEAEAQDTQPTAVFMEPESEVAAQVTEVAPVSEVALEPVIQAVEPPVAAEPEALIDSVSATVLEPTPTVLEPTPTVEEAVAVPDEVEAPVAEMPVPVDAIAEPSRIEESPRVEEPSEVTPIAASALAVAAGAAAAAGLAHVIHAEPAHFEESSGHPTATEPSHPQHEPFGDAALAEELAAALSSKESEERARAAMDSAAVAALESGAMPDSVHVPGIDSQGLSDHKLADAVARAFENLKPQIITEIIKELAK